MQKYQCGRLRVHLRPRQERNVSLVTTCPEDWVCPECGVGKNDQPHLA
jgi:hypothetical protein